MARADFQDVADEYAGALLGTPALEWLIARGLTERTVFGAQIGYVAEPLVSEHDRFRGCLAIPYHDARYKVRQFRFRRLEGEPKYDAPTGSSGHLYRVRNSTAPVVYVAEGEFDTLVLEQLGFDAVGVPGAQAFKKEWVYLLEGCDEVVTVFDGDDAGAEGARRIRDLLAKQVRVRSVALPPGKDVTDCFLANAEALMDRLAR